jgi:hypothetical protein
MVATTASNIMYTTSTSYLSDYNYSSEWTGTGNSIYAPYWNSTDNIYRKYTTSDSVTAPTSYWTNPIISTDVDYYPYFYVPRILSKEDMLQLKREELRSNLIIRIKSRSNASQYPGEVEPERRALETLRETITEAEFRKYLRYGFVLVKGQSGKTYQIFKNQSHCKVWLGGKLVEEVCVRIKNKQVPMTDNVIAFKMMIEASEDDFKKLGNVYKMAG